ncbi:response regulator transcription factor [Corynebacterium bovis]|uniref:response regulator transcription factor n=1 Tax=Corynebacterium bovis TaxID=36808 RepID=UPI002448411C|nr:response regulator transcription factor [Corynebacterium bovis]MDH2456369.1 response regulator transcription factor [Corynebacterium bovis]
MPNAHPIRVIVVDDDPLVRSSLRLYFSSDEDIVVVGEAANGSEAVDLIERHLVDVVMADIHMPEMDGLTLLDRVRARSNPPVFIGMTALDSDETMLHILSHGGHGYVLKSSEPQFLIQAVKDAYKGGTTVSPQPASRLMQHLPQNRGSVDVKKVELNETEELVLSLLCEGLSNSDISKRSGFSEATVKKYVSSLFERFNATSRLSLAVNALNSGFTPRPDAGDA